MLITARIFFTFISSFRSSNIWISYIHNLDLVSYWKQNITDRSSDWTLLWMLRFSMHETWRKCIGNCSTANVLCKQFWTKWRRGSFSISSEEGKIMEGFNCKELLEKHWRDPWDDPCLMHKPAEKLLWFKRDWHDTWCVVCFICFSEKYFCKR